MKYRYICVLFLSLVVSSLIGCSLPSRNNHIHRVRMIQDEDSKLIPLLISENDFSSDWRWYSILIKQETVVPTPENSDLVEQAVVNYGGYFQNEDVLVSIWETVERYKTFPPTIDPDNIN